MTVRERVLASRLIEKINDNPKYARQIGLSYEMEKLENAGVVKREGKYICITSKELLEKFL